MHTVEKIGGTSMSDYASVRDNIILGQRNKNELYNRIFVVSAYGGITNRLLEHKKSGQAGVYSLFASSIKSDEWLKQFESLREDLRAINETLFGQTELLNKANQFLDEIGRAHV